MPHNHPLLWKPLVLQMSVTWVHEMICVKCKWGSMKGLLIFISIPAAHLFISYIQKVIVSVQMSAAA